MKSKHLLPVAALAILVAQPGYARITLPEIISSNAVLQQQSDVLLWGWAEPGTEISIMPSWHTQHTYTAKAGTDGKWEVRVSTPEASFEPQSIVFAQRDGDHTVTIDNLLVGEVWLCSGQSNMEMPLRGYWAQPVEGAGQAIAYSANYPGIRVVTIPKSGSFSPVERTSGEWKLSNPANAWDFTALGFFFAQSLTDMLHVPVGIISCAYGGSKVEGWIPDEILAGYSDFDLKAERENPSPNEWERIGVMYNAMLHPIEGYTVKGFLWNQGESNVGRTTYPEHFADMVEYWRQQWGDKSLPIYAVELPGWNYDNPDATNAAEFRLEQWRAADLVPNSGIVSTSDLVYPEEVTDIHARRKKEIGERMAMMAAAETYGIEGIPYRSPRLGNVTIDGNKAILRFTDAPGGLTPNRNLPGFEVAGADGVFYPAQADENLSNLDVVISSDKVDSIDQIRYCFRNFAIGGVHSMTGQPLVPFKWSRNNEK